MFEIEPGSSVPAQPRRSSCRTTRAKRGRDAGHGLTARRGARRPGDGAGASAILLLAAMLCLSVHDKVRAQSADDPSFEDLSLLVAPDMPCTWPAIFPPFQINHHRQIGPLSAYNVDILMIDPNTGTQIDVPTHSIARPDSNLPQAGRFGTMYNDKVPAWQFGGEACVIDCRDLLDSTPNGRSPLVTKERIMFWEREHRPLSQGDVVLLYSGYTDEYYKPLPEGERLIVEPLAGKTPAWPDPDPECMEYLASRGVMHVGTDSPSMGPIPFLQEPTHVAGLKHGMVFTEGATALGTLPATGAFYCAMGPKHIGAAGCEARAFAIKDRQLAARLIESARNKRVVDLSVTLSPDLPVWWPGTGQGDHRQPFFKVYFSYNPNVDSPFQTHVMDSHSGTHLVPPAYALPPDGFDNSSLSPEVQQWLNEYERRYGVRGTSEVTADQVPLSHVCGPARVIDVGTLVGSTDEAEWPASAQITPDVIRIFESRHGPLKAGEIVIFSSGYSDAWVKPFPAGEACMAEPLTGKREGWPAVTPEAVIYLAEKGIRCVATDGPTVGGVDPRQALMTYWALGSRGMVAVEFLTNVAQLPEDAYFLFAAPKIRNGHGGPGRAVALY